MVTGSPEGVITAAMHGDADHRVAASSASASTRCDRADELEEDDRAPGAGSRCPNAKIIRPISAT